MTGTTTTAGPIGIYDPARPDEIQAFIPEADKHTALPEGIKVYEAIKLAEQALVAMGASATVRNAWLSIARKTARADWYSTDSGPLCWMRQTDLARELGIGERQFHNVERQLARFGLIARDVPANGFRGHRRRDDLRSGASTGSGSSPRRSGLSLEPAIRNFQAITKLVARANKAEAERSDRMFEARKTERRLRDLIAHVPATADRETFAESFAQMSADYRPKQLRSARVAAIMRWQGEMDTLEGRVRALLARLSAGGQHATNPSAPASADGRGEPSQSPAAANLNTAPTRPNSPFPSPAPTRAQSYMPGTVAPIAVSGLDQLEKTRRTRETDPGKCSPSSLSAEPRGATEATDANRSERAERVAETAQKQDHSDWVVETGLNIASRKPDNRARTAEQPVADVQSRRNSGEGTDVPDAIEPCGISDTIDDAAATGASKATGRGNPIETAAMSDTRPLTKQRLARSAPMRRPRVDEIGVPRKDSPTAPRGAGRESRSSDSIRSVPGTHLRVSERHAHSAPQQPKISAAPEIGFRCHIQPESKAMVACSGRQPSQGRSEGSDDRWIPPLGADFLRVMSTERLLSIASDAAACHVERYPWAEAARHVRHDLGVDAAAWDEASRAMTAPVAFIALLVIDRNRFHPDTPIRNPGGALRAFARRARMGRLDLARSVFGILDRQRKGLQPKL